MQPNVEQYKKLHTLSGIALLPTFLTYLFLKQCFLNGFKSEVWTTL